MYISYYRTKAENLNHDHQENYLPIKLGGLCLNQA